MWLVSNGVHRRTLKGDNQAPPPQVLLQSYKDDACAGTKKPRRVSSALSCQLLQGVYGVSPQLSKRSVGYEVELGSVFNTAAHISDTFCTVLYTILYYTILYYTCHVAGRPGSSEVPRNPLTRWDVSSIPANGIFLTKKKTKKQNKNAQRVENDYIVSTQNSTSRSTRERNG